MMHSGPMPAGLSSEIDMNRITPTGLNPDFDMNRMIPTGLNPDFDMNMNRNDSTRLTLDSDNSPQACALLKD